MYLKIRQYISTFLLPRCVVKPRNIILWNTIILLINNGKLGIKSFQIRPMVFIVRKLGTISNVCLEYQISCGKLSISVSELSVWATIMVSNGKFNTQIGISSRTTADVY